MFHASPSSTNHASGTQHQSSQSPQHVSSVRTLAKHHATDLCDAIDQMEPDGFPPLPVHCHPIQAKLIVGSAQDRFEHEADHLAEAFVQSHDPHFPFPNTNARIEQPETRKPHITPVPLSPERWNQPTANFPQSTDRSDISHLLNQESGMGMPLPDHLARSFRTLFSNAIRTYQITHRSLGPTSQSHLPISGLYHSESHFHWFGWSLNGA